VALSGLGSVRRTGPARAALLRRRRSPGLVGGFATGCVFGARDLRGARAGGRCAGWPWGSWGGRPVSGWSMATSGCVRVVGERAASFGVGRRPHQVAFRRLVSGPPVSGLADSHTGLASERLVGRPVSGWPVAAPGCVRAADGRAAGFGVGRWPRRLAGGRRARGRWSATAPMVFGGAGGPPASAHPRSMPNQRYETSVTKFEDLLVTENVHLVTVSENDLRSLSVARRAGFTGSTCVFNPCITRLFTQC